MVFLSRQRADLKDLGCPRGQETQRNRKNELCKGSVIWVSPWLLLGSPGLVLALGLLCGSGPGSSGTAPGWSWLLLGISKHHFWSQDIILLRFGRTRSQLQAAQISAPSCAKPR